MHPATRSAGSSPRLAEGRRFTRRKDEAVRSERIWPSGVVSDARVFCFQVGVLHPEARGAIGSPISPVVSDIYVENFERAMVSFMGIPPRVWWRYVDDTFVIIKELMRESFFSHISRETELSGPGPHECNRSCSGPR